MLGLKGGSLDCDAYQLRTDSSSTRPKWTVTPSQKRSRRSNLYRHLIYSDFCCPYYCFRIFFCIASICDRQSFFLPLSLSPSFYSRLVINHRRNFMQTMIIKSSRDILRLSTCINYSVIMRDEKWKRPTLRCGDFFAFFGNFVLMLSRRQLTEIIITVIRMLMRNEIAIREHLVRRFFCSKFQRMWRWLVSELGSESMKLVVPKCLIPTSGLRNNVIVNVKANHRRNFFVFRASARQHKHTAFWEKD